MKLETYNLRKSFGGIHAVRDICVTFHPGEITGVVGPNGSGKTTLMNLISGVIPQDSGTIAIGEHVKISSIQPYRLIEHGITRTFQAVRIFEQMTVLDNVLVVITKKGVFDSLADRHTAQHEVQAERVLKLTNLWQKRKSLASSLSYGQRKLLEIARALVTNAEIYLFDEPFAGLFPEMIETVVTVLQALKAEGKTVIIIEHNITLIRKITDRLYVLDAGEVIASGEPNEVLSLHSVKEAYLGE